MAEKTTKTPPTTPAAPLGGDDFAKFARAIPSGLPDDVLKHIITEEPSGPVPPLKTPGVESYLPAPVAPGQPAPEGRLPNPEEQTQQAYRAMLRAEEERLAMLPKPPALFSAPAQSVVPSAFGVGAAELVVREGADPLLVESFKLLRRLVAGGMIQPGAFDPRQLFSLLERLHAAISPKPVVEAPPPVVTG